LEGSGTELAGECTFFYRKVNENLELGTGFLMQNKIITATVGVEFVSHRMSYIIQRGCWCHIVLNDYAITG
jgi:hypothetical protein